MNSDISERIKNTHGIIFDLDGVLISTDELHFSAWSSLCRAHGLYFDREINEKLRGVSREESLSIILSENERAGKASSEQFDKNDLATEKNEKYKELLATLTPDLVHESTRDTLTKLSNRGYRLSVGSSSKNTAFILEKLDLRKYFCAVSDGTNIERSKPDPEVFLKAADFSGVLYTECAVVEDADAGIVAAYRAGMLPVGIGNAKKHRNTAVKIDSIPELLDIFN